MAIPHEGADNANNAERADRRHTRREIRKYALGALLLLGVIALLYWPGLAGGYIFDDETNILKNAQIKLQTLDRASLNAAAWSGSAGPLKRPVSMLSFALNHYLTGLDPWFFKLTNLLIHLANTALVGVLAHALLKGFATGRRVPGAILESPRFPLHGAFWAMALWGAHPLNLTSVLYIVQRMTSLSTLFGLLALNLYAAWRLSPGSWPWRRLAGTWLLIVLLIVLSVYSKESGILFAVLLLWVELLVFRGLRAGTGKPLRVGPARYLHLVYGTLAVGAILLAWKLPALTNPEFFLRRGFTLEERLMTESRALFYYLRLFFIPSLSELSIYHDDFTISESLWRPPATALSLLGLACVSLCAIRGRRKYPVFLFAWGWFLIGHALESTFISLELVHEHRNYFATIGFAVCAPWLAWSSSARFRRPAFLLAGGFALLFAFVTWQRALIWSSPLEHALFEAESHPHSERANYQLGLLYAQYWTASKDPKFGPLATAAMREAMRGYKASNGPWFAMLHLAYYGNRKADPAIVRQLRERLATQPFVNSNINFLNTFLECQRKKLCKMPHMQVLELLAAAAQNPTADNWIRAILYRHAAGYYVNTLGDLAKGEEFLRDSIAEYAIADTYLFHAEVLGGLGRLEEAKTQIATAEQLDTHRLWQARVVRLRKKIGEVERATTLEQPASSASRLEHGEGIDSTP
ncbi:MAG: hypothetical protein LBO79_07655 [Zoogloeaceae bacterium]|nr:hypothetical protein [Zoogloeaceae bacterium]